MICQSAVLLNLSSEHIIQPDTPLALWGALCLTFLGASSAFAFAASAVRREHLRFVGNIAAGAGCVLAWAYYVFTGPWQHLALRVGAPFSLLYALPNFPFLLVASILTLRDIFLGIKLAVGKRIGPIEFEVKSPRAILREMEGSAYFIPGVYVAVAALMFAVLYLVSLRTTVASAMNASKQLDTFSIVLTAAGLLLVVAAILRNVAPAASGVFALQGALAGSWFGLTVFLSSSSFWLWPPPVSDASSQSLGVGFWEIIRFALFFFPLLWAFSCAIRDLRPVEKVPVIFMRTIAGCALLTMLPAFEFANRTGPSSVPLFLASACIFYLLAAFHLRLLFPYAAVTAVACSSIATIIAGFLAIVPDFGGRISERERWTELLICLANAALAIASSMALASRALSKKARA